MKRFFISLLSLPLLLGAADIYLAGDSSMQDYPETRAPLTGWGTALKSRVKEGCNVFNMALGGRSSKSFITEKHWEKLLSKAKKGDFVIIQFGHNDTVAGEKNFYRFTQPEKVFPHYLKIYIAEARERGLIPVLCTQTMTCRFDKKGKSFNPPDSNAKYVDACRKVAAETGCDLLDLNLYAMKKMDSIGEEAARKYYLYLEKGELSNYPDGKQDSCHLRMEGAKFYAAAAVELAKTQKLPLAELFK